MRTGGIDLGSRTVKIVVLENDVLTLEKLYETVHFYRNYGRQENDKLIVNFAALGIGRVDKLAATGYGRNTVNVAGATIIAELKAHTIGAVRQTGLTDFTLLDLGGQDSKVIKVRKGRMVDFATNDKCAASTGRYLENMANVLGISLEKLSQYDEEPVALNATCAIFGESELIGRIVEGHPVARLAAGVNYTIFKRIKPMLTAMKSDTLVFCGGVARGPAIRRLIEREIGCRVVVPEYPQLNGAIGCAAYAGEEGK